MRRGSSGERWGRGRGGGRGGLQWGVVCFWGLQRVTGDKICGSFVVWKGGGDGGVAGGFNDAKCSILCGCFGSARIRDHPGYGRGGGRVAVFGGFDGEKILSSVEIFTAEGDAACSGGLGRWIHGVDMPKARMACAYCVYRGRAVLLGGTKIY
jgi:hypothetical protein